MSYNIVAHEGMTLIEGIYSREQRAKRACLHAHLATAARVKDPAALQRYKFDAPLLAAGSLTFFAADNLFFWLFPYYFWRYHGLHAIKE